MSELLNINNRYIQIAFNHSLIDVQRILPQIPRDNRIIIEAGTPFIKREGIQGIQKIREIWPGFIVADLKVSDGAYNEVYLARVAGANAVIALGAAPLETLDFFNKTCQRYGIVSMIDMLGQEAPLKKLIRLNHKPDVIIIHKGRDEELNPRKIIRYKDINKIRSKLDVKITVAGGIGQKHVRKAYFNGANIVLLNITKQREHYEGLLDISNFRTLLPLILKDVGF